MSESFEPLPENLLARRAVTRLERHILGDRSFPILTLHGPTGCGKTHLITEVETRLINARPQLSSQTLPAADARSEVFSDTRRLLELDVLILDNMQFLPPVTAEALAHIIEGRSNRRRFTVALATSGPGDWKELPPRLTDRFTGGLVVGIQPLSFASRRQMLKRFLFANGRRITKPALDWLAEASSPGVRPLIGLVQRLQQTARDRPPPWNLACVQNALREEEPSRTTSLSEIAKFVAENFDVSVKEMCGPSRVANVRQARQIAIYLSRELSGLSLMKLGDFFGGRDHSTVLHACRKVEDLMGEDETLRTKITDALTTLGHSE